MAPNTHGMRSCLAVTISVLFLTLAPCGAQSLGNAGTIDGTVTDPSGAAVSGAQVTAHNAVTGYVGSSRVDLQACKLEYSIVSPK